MLIESIVSNLAMKFATVGSINLYSDSIDTYSNIAYYFGL